LLLSFLGGIVFTLVGGYFFSSGLLRPVKKITNEVAEISAHNLTRRIDAGKSKDEWYKLSQTLNELLNRLQESFETQRRFISNASHELSTPLTAISSQLEVILQKERDPESYRKVMQSVLQDVRNLSRLTQTLLEFAKASGNAGGIEIQPVRIDELLMQMPAEMQKQNKEYSVSLEFDNMPDNENALVVYGNGELLFTAIKNIVGNACKYSPDKKATVYFYCEGNQLIIQIIDSGIGISESDLQNIYHPFYRVDESRTTPGFGLGLSLANRIIKLHKGNIKVKSKLNEGSTFTVALPSAKG
jgi:two-component system, OmpR family, sensor histidine kinase ArlS